MRDNAIRISIAPLGLANELWCDDGRAAPPRSWRTRYASTTHRGGIRVIATRRVPCSRSGWCVVFSRGKAVGAAIVLAACQSHEPAEPRDHAPAVAALYVASAHDQDGRISVAIVVDGERVIGYVCGDDPSEDDYTGWFHGELGGDGHFVLTHHDWALDGFVTAEGITGTLAEPNRVVTYDGTRASDRIFSADLTGLYVAEDSGCQTGVIVIDDGNPATAPLVQGAWCDGTGLALPVTPIVPIELIEDRLAVRIMNPGAPRRLLTTPIIDRAGLLQVNFR
jgi:hypothetical protein